MSYNIYYLLGGLLIVYLFITMANKRTARRRKSRRFMEGYERKDRRKEDDKKVEAKENKEGSE